MRALRPARPREAPDGTKYLRMEAMDYAAAIEHLYGLGQELAPPSDGSAPRRKFDLATMRVLVEALGNPQSRVPSVLIAGTNGKGSTAATLASILNAAGYRTGLYTSPHLIRVNERMQLTGSDGSLRPIADEEFARAYSAVWETSARLVREGRLPHGPSFFEILTAAAFLWFAEREAEVMVLEVGLGGRLDATNIVEPMISVITDIALDHQDYLGDTITLIAGEKAGILRANGTLVTLPQHPEANQAIGVAATALGVRGVNAARYIPPPTREVTTQDGALPRNCYRLNLEDGDAPILVDSPLAGAHQQRNLALAIATAMELRNTNGYKISNEALELGIQRTEWPGRLEPIGEDLLLDVAHNPAGAWALRAAIAALPEARPRTLIFSCLKDKDLKEMSRILFPLFDSSADPLRRHDHLVLAPIPNPRAASVEDLLAAARALGVPAHAAPQLAGALAEARSVTPEGGIIFATGSVFLVGEIRALCMQAEREMAAAD